MGGALQQLLFLQGGDLSPEALAIGPAFVGIGEVAKSWTREQVGGPEQEVEEFLRLGFHGRTMVRRRQAVQCQSFVAYATKDWHTLAAMNPLGLIRLSRRGSRAISKRVCPRVSARKPCDRSGRWRG